jgi:CBS domain-containing protein
LLTQCFMIKDVVTTTKNINVKECIELLSKRHIGSIVIIDQEGRIEGIFTERDAIRVLAQNIPLEAPIEKVMTKNVFTVSVDSTLQEARTVIRFHGIRHLPVVDAEGKLVGLISVRHLLHELTGM